MDIKSRIQTIAILGAQSLFWTKGFRQKDITFIAQLFTNWIDILILPDLPIWNNTNSLRALESLNKNGFIYSNGQFKNKTYHLTKLGFFELLNELIESSKYHNISHVLLTFYFLKAYGNRMLELVTEHGSGYSKATQESIKDLLNANRYLKLQLQEIDIQIKRIKIRLDETISASRLAEKMSSQNDLVSTIIQKVSEDYPYELNSQKPMTELLKEIDPQLRLWELTSGNQHRANILLNSQLKILENNKSVLLNL